MQLCDYPVMRRRRLEHGKGKGNVNMKILVIGGSYFFGRVFVMQAAGVHNVTVVNRGTYSMEGFGVRQIKGDRKDVNLWKGIREDYDAIVDFCAYEEGDVAGVLRNMPGRISQYVLISTVDVYQRGIGGRKDEDAPLETRLFEGDAGKYIAGKAALEREVQAECAKRGTHCTVLRPAILYGPLNYAPREAAYIQMIVKKHMLPHVTDASGKFQAVYVKDAAQAALKVLLNEGAYGRAYNLCQDEVLTYDILYEELKRAAAGQQDEAKELSCTVKEAEKMGIPLPFPVTEEESELCSNERSKRELGMEYISLQEGMDRTYRAFKRVYA